MLCGDLQSRFGLAEPRVLVCGLNPHAGENGHLGSEELETISPVVQRFAEKGYMVTGPIPADTIFTRGQLEKFDCILAMYHDQGLPVIKHQAFGDVVNITLGLPIIRTSVDHGTALELAATGSANESSLLAAMTQAIAFARNAIPGP